MNDFVLIEEEIRQAAPKIDREFKQNLLNELFKILPKERKMTNWGRKQGIIWAALVIVLGLLFVTPAGKALADLLLRWRNYEFTDDPTGVEVYLTATPEKVVILNSDSYKTAAEASEGLGFTVYVPTELPEGYIKDGNISVGYRENGEVIGVAVVYRKGGYAFEIFYSQKPLAEDADEMVIQFGISDAEIDEVMVGDYEGVFIEGYYRGTTVDDEGNHVPKPNTLLIWEQDESQFWLSSDELLGLDELIGIALSISP